MPFFVKLNVSFAQVMPDSGQINYSLFFLLFNLFVFITNVRSFCALVADLVSELIGGI